MAGLQRRTRRPKPCSIRTLQKRRLALPWKPSHQMLPLATAKSTLEVLPQPSMEQHSRQIMLSALHITSRFRGNASSISSSIFLFRKAPNDPEELKEAAKAAGLDATALRRGQQIGHRGRTIERLRVPLTLVSYIYNQL